MVETLRLDAFIKSDPLTDEEVAQVDWRASAHVGTAESDKYAVRIDGEWYWRLPKFTRGTVTFRRFGPNAES